jgi:polygalacturonase
VDNLVVRYSRVDARRLKHDGHDVIDLTAFNTDGFDMARCNGVHIHDSTVWNQDDCFDIKDGTSNVLIERVNASGVGLTIGSIASTVRNITFRDAYMHHTMKGIYMKFRGPGSVSNVLYENIVMEQPEQWAIWIGGAQQCDGCDITSICSAGSGTCSLCWPSIPSAECHAPANAQYSNITLRNITINNPKKSAGVLIANASSPMQNVVFDNVVVNNPVAKPWGDGYFCKNVNGIATGSTYPVPPCFKDMTAQVSNL